MTPENIVKKECCDYLDFNGWFHFNIRQSRYCYKGVSDRIAMKRGIVLFIEFKTAKGKQSPDQLKFEADVKSKNCHYLVARGYKDIIEYLNKIDFF